MFADDMTMLLICGLAAASSIVSAIYAARSAAASFDAMRYAIKAGALADAALKNRRDAQHAAASARADAILAGDAADDVRALVRPLAGVTVTDCDDDPAQDWEPADVGAHI